MWVGVCQVTFAIWLMKGFTCFQIAKFEESSWVSVAKLG